MRKTNSAVPRAAHAAVTVAVSMAALLALAVLAGIAPAAADPAQDKFISDYCNQHADASDCNDWRYNRARWSSEQYQAFYAAHRGEKELYSAEAAAAFGQPTEGLPSGEQSVSGQPITVQTGDASQANWPVGSHRGNVVGNQPEVIGGSENHVADCEATFKSYDVTTDSYMALDGTRQRCKL